MPALTLSEKTLIPISFVIVLIGGIVWITNIAFKVDVSAESLKKIELRQNTIDEIKTDVAVIKSKLEKIDQKLDRR